MPAKKKPPVKPDEGRRATIDEIKQFAEYAATLSPLQYDEYRALMASAIGIRMHVFDLEVERQKSWLKSLLPKRITLTDAGNGLRFCNKNAYDVAFCKQRSKLGWFHWDGKRWAPDALGAAMELARMTAIEMSETAYRDYKQQDITAEVWKAETNWATQSLSHDKLSAMLSQASAGTELCLEGSKFDARPELLNLQNGTYNLHTGEFETHRRGDMITLIAGTDYNLKATCPLWEQFVNTSLQGDQELIAYLRRASGYLLTGTQKEACFFLISGPQGSGKSTYWRTMRYIMADYFAMVSSGLFVKKSAWKAADGEGATPALVALVGKRVACEVELSEGDKFDSGLLKRITGGEALTARPLYGGLFTFQPQCVPVFLSNHTPGTNDFSGGLQSRLRIIKFDHVIRGTDQEDKDLVGKLQAEASGILMWCLRGLEEYKKLGGLKEPEVIKASVEKYFQNENVVARFLSERATVQKITGTVVSELEKNKLATFSSMYATFKHWADTNNEDYGSARWFGGRMKQLGFVTVSDREHAKYYQFKLSFPESSC